MKSAKWVVRIRAAIPLCAILACGGLGLSPASSADTATNQVNAAPAVSGTWKSIDQNLAQLTKLIGTGKLDDLGSSAYGIANLVKTLPGQSGALPAADLSKVSASVPIVGALVTKLDKAGEKGNKQGVEEGITALQNKLSELRRLYYK